ncbi:Chemotaxis response regulator protein-glutamate methylesterase of group 2 operon [uncultured Defluviicoccus sp.]|uniref:protein-glutamate methylesterase n=1 Tax=metagenome TaxID=256318 RepID=A0A380T7Y9_9ZZZZ|nr:Chemotaxis response regulator protein-glutamate methylesterase of group 2 operon [uncultured Defluviicoccus sp.]
MATAPVGVLLVDDSAVVRGLIQRGVEADPDIRVLGAANNGQTAIDMAKALAPDVVLLDIEMPVMDGLEALPRILAARPGAAVIMASALTHRHAGMSFRALQLGAADYVPKPDAANGQGAMPAFLDELKTKIKAHGRGANVAKPPALRAAPHLRKLKPAAIAIASSTGGPPALLKVFAGVKGRLTCPVFITQHMPATFTAMLAEQLARVAGIPASEGVSGTAVAPGHIYVAPGGRHMLVERGPAGPVIELSDAAPENFCKPAADPMLRSLAKVYGPGLLVAMLTGMGRDGADGCVAVANAGGNFFVQDEASSVVWGMPGAAFRTGRAMGQLSLDAAADYLAAAMRGSP